MDIKQYVVMKLKEIEEQCKGNKILLENDNEYKSFKEFLYILNNNEESLNEKIKDDYLNQLEKIKDDYLNQLEKIKDYIEDNLFCFKCGLDITICSCKINHNLKVIFGHSLLERISKAIKRIKNEDNKHYTRKGKHL